jgi:predicted dehydrogenase
MSQINIAIVGLGFGAEFIPIYQRHPDANMFAICQRTRSKLDEIGDKFGIATRYTSYEELLEDPEVHAVHINSPIPDHGRQSIQALKAGKHVACTVPMATSLDECKQIIDLCKETGLKYMMMETVVYAREFLFMKELYEKGDLGKIQFLKASHQQDMEGWPGYWPGLPPMYYATHCVGPILGLMGSEAEYVSCFGSGTIAEEMHACYGSPFAVETCHIKFKDSDLSAQVIRSLFDVARQYRESFEVYGTRQSVEWPLIEHEPLVIHTAKLPEPEIPSKVSLPGFRALPAGGNPRLHHRRRLWRRGGRGAPLVHPGRRTWRVPPSPRPSLRRDAQNRQGHGGADDDPPLCMRGAWAAGSPSHALPMRGAHHCAHLLVPRRGGR